MPKACHSSVHLTDILLSPQTIRVARSYLVSALVNVRNAILATASSSHRSHLLFATVLPTNIN